MQTIPLPIQSKLRLCFSSVLNVSFYSQQQEESGDFAKALSRLREKEFDEIIELCTKEIESESV